MLFYGLPRQSGEVDSLKLSFLFVFLYVLVSVFILFLCMNPPGRERLS